MSVATVLARLLDLNLSLCPSFHTPYGAFGASFSPSRQLGRLDRLTHDMELLFQNASTNEVTANTRQKQASPELLRRSSLSAEASWYFRSLFAADWTFVQRYCPHAH